MDREKYICIIYILHVCFSVLWKVLPASHEQTQFYFDANNSSQKKEKDKRKRKYSVCNFMELCHMPEERQK